MKRLVLLAVVVPLLMAPGCPRHEFEVVMQTLPDGKVQRELTVWTSEDSKINPPSDDVLAAAQAAYGGDGVAVDGKHRFVGSFERDLPADLVHEGMKNYGFFSVAESRMGSVRTYVERMPGEADLRALFRRAEQIADTLARVMDAGLREHLAAEVEPEKLVRLKVFLTTEFRDDLLNALLIGWQAVVRGSTIEDLRDAWRDDDAGAEKRTETFWVGEMARIIAFGVQEGYVTGEVTLIDEDQWSGDLLRGVIRKAAFAMGYAPDERLPRALAELTDGVALEGVYEAGLKSVGMTSEQFNEMLEPALPDLFGGGTNGEVVWRCKSAPIMTNGEFDSDAGELRWYAVGRKGCAPPQMLFATWAEPDEKFQREHLGRAALTGEALGEYVSWRAGLVAAEQSQWDEFVVGLKPGAALEHKLQTFRFGETIEVGAPTGDATAMGEVKPQPVPGSSLLLSGLGFSTDQSD